jgi:hypothetical protein
MRQGDAEFGRQDFAKALSFYQAAHAIMGVPTTGIALARAEERVGRWVEAREAALEVTRSIARADEPPAFTAARADAASLADRLGAKIPSLVVRVRGAAARQADVRITIDGVAARAADGAVTRRLNPGIHRITASGAGFRDGVADVRLAEAEHREVELALVPRNLASTPDPPIDGATGSSPTALRPIAFVALGVGFIGLSAGTVTGVLSLRETSTLKERCQGDACQPDAREDLDRANTLATISNVSFVIGVVSVATGVVLLATLGRSSSKPAAGRPGTAARLAWPDALRGRF